MDSTLEIDRLPTEPIASPIDGRLHYTVEESLDREQWLSSRRSTIGSSDVGVLLGLAPPTRGSQYSLWLEKTAALEPPKDEAECLFVGREMETYIARTWSRLSGTRLATYGPLAKLRSLEIPYLSATLDFFTPEYDPEVIEIKNVSEFAWNSEWDKGSSVPDYYISQVQHQMRVTGFTRARVVAYVGGRKFEAIEVDREDDFIEYLDEQCASFWNLVETRTPPEIPAEAGESALDAIKRRWPRHDPNSEIVLDESAETLVLEYDRISALGKQVEKEQTALKARIADLLQEKEFGILPSGRVITYRTEPRKAYSVGASSPRVLRVAKRGGR